MTNIEEKALKYYPEDMGTLEGVKHILRVGYVNGYKQAEKDIKKALLEWLNGYNHPVTRLLIKEVIDKINSL